MAKVTTKITYKIVLELTRTTEEFEVTAKSELINYIKGGEFRGLIQKDLRQKKYFSDKDELTPSIEFISTKTFSATHKIAFDKFILFFMEEFEGEFGSIPKLIVDPTLDSSSKSKIEMEGDFVKVHVLGNKHFIRYGGNFLKLMKYSEK